VPTHFKGPSDQTRAPDTYIKLVRASGTLLGRVGRVAAAAGITHTQFGVLEALLHLGPLSQRDLGRKLLISGGNVTMVVTNLETRGLVRRGRSPDDARVVMVGLTDSGRSLIDRAFAEAARELARIMDVLSAEDQAALGDLCRRLGRSAAGD